MIENMLVQKVNIIRPTQTKDASGGIVETASTLYANVPASVQPVAASWLVQYAQRNVNVSHTVFTNKQVSLRAGDQIVFGTRTFQFQGQRNLIELGRVYAIDCLEVGC